MKKQFLLLIILFGYIYYPIVVLAQVKNKVYKATRINKVPKIDGIINDFAWKNLPIATDFIQYEPYNGSSASQNTEVRLAYDNKAIYISAILYDQNPDSIMSELSMRDITDGNTDIFAFTILPFNDGLNGYSFWVTAAGVQADYKNTNDQMDANWDAVWESKTAIVDNGWQVEIKIPYSAIRFPKTEVQTWGINFMRSIRRKREWSTWNFIDKNLGTYLPQSATLIGIKDVKSRLRLSVTPYISTYIENNSGTNKTGYFFNGGLDLKYGINESFTLDMTLIPDFGQVQSDDIVLNLSPDETYYDEKRSFFTEGTELFDRCNLFYSRRIGSQPTGYYDVQDIGDIIIENPNKTNLINATKISGRNKKGLGIGFFNAMTSKTFATLEDSLDNKYNIITQPFTNYNMFVLDKSLKNNSYISFVNTNVSRFKDNYVANVTGTQFDLLNKTKSYGIYGKGIISQIYNKTNKNIGFNYNIGLKKISGFFSFYIQRSVLSNNYIPNDLGYLARNNYSENKLKLSYKIYKPFWVFLRGNSNLTFTHRNQYLPNKFISINANWSIETLFKNHTSTFFNYIQDLSTTNDFYESRQGKLFIRPGTTFLNFFISPDYRKRFLIDFGGNYTYSASFNNMYEINKYSINISPRLRISNKMTVVYKFNYKNALREYGYVNFIDTNNTVIFGERKLKTITNSISTAYIFNNVSSISFRLRHYWSTAYYSNFFELNDDGLLDKSTYSSNHNINFNAFTIDMAYKWQFLPGSELSIVWKNNIFTSGNDIITSFNKNFQNTLDAPNVNSISIKILYYIDYQYLKKK